MQSAYRESHSTEIGLIRCSNVIRKMTSRNKSLLMVLLDLSSAFDTVQHHLIDILKKSYGLGGAFASFFDMYLRDRTVKVLGANVLSDSIEQPTGVPQGSILGPSLFLLYLNPLLEALDAIGCLYEFYADDSQFFFEIHEGRLTSKCEVLRRVEECLEAQQR